jgi:hypothetical protein
MLRASSSGAALVSSASETLRPGWPSSFTEWCFHGRDSLVQRFIPRSRI